jgi:hypothetical protein
VSREALHEKVDATAAAILGLANVPTEGGQSREHILIAHLLLNAWLAGKDLDLERLIQQIQAPPIAKIGAFDVETFFPEKERLRLAVGLNTLLASPSIASWIQGEPLDLAAMLRAPDGRPRQLIFYLAHLDDTQRMFFLTLLLEEVLAWTRAQQGTTGLRAILYVDEVFGYLPPHPANPPTKGPLLTLMKQARAFGVGVLLATQNPVDLDYKALTNAGTWFVGKLQTERDKARLLEGLEGVAAAQGTLTDRAHLDQVISSLGNRVFLLHNVHSPRPVLFHTRWALSYLAGPLTRDQVAQLAAPMKAVAAPAGTASPAAAAEALIDCPRCGTALPARAKFCMECGVRLPAATPAEVEFKAEIRRASAEDLPAAAATEAPPPAGTLEPYYLPAVPLASTPEDTAVPRLHYEPRLLAFADVLFADARRGVEFRRPYRLLAAPPAGGEPVGWGQAEAVTDDVAVTPESGPATWAPLPEGLDRPKHLKLLERSFVEFLQANGAHLLLTNKALELTSDPGENQQAFLERCREVARRASEAELAELKEKYRARFAGFDSKLRQSQAELQQAQQAAAELLKQGDSLLGFLWSWGRPASPPQETREQKTAMRKLQKAQSEVSLAREKLQAEWEAAVKKVAARWQEKGEDVREVRLAPRKSDIRVVRFGLAWAPFWLVTGPGGTTRRITAYARQTRTA